MARKAIYKHATQVDVNTYPDDGTSPVGTNEWNEAPDAQGMLGFAPQTSTIAISSGNLVITDSVCVASAESGTTDTIDTLDITNTNEYDILYLYADTGDTITVTHTSSPSSNGHIKTAQGANITLSETKPTVFMRKGNYWYEVSGRLTVSGTANEIEVTQTDGNLTIGLPNDVTISGNLTVSGTTTTIDSTTLTVDDKNIELGTVASPSDVTADGGGITLKGTTDKTIIWDDTNDNWTSSEHWNLASGKELKINNATIADGSNLYLTAQSSAPADPSSGIGKVYVKTIDANNEGIFIKIKKNGSIVEVQIA